MLLIERYRGFISNEDKGINISYYLYTSGWYRMLSPTHIWSGETGNAIYIASDGNIFSNNINNVGGVLL